MAYLGVHFALDSSEEARVLVTKDDNELMDIIEEIEAAWDESYLQETGKAWDAIHRCLSDGTLKEDGGRYPLNLCILGGKHLYRGDDNLVVFVSRNEVADVARALEPLDETWLRERYFKINPRDYGFSLSEEDFEYTLSWFEPLKEFYRDAARSGRSVIFTADQ